MVQIKKTRLEKLDEAALHMIMEGTSNEIGVLFFRSLVKNLAKTLEAKGAWVTEYIPDTYSLSSIAFWLDGNWVDEFEYSIPGTPCEVVIKEKRVVHVPEKVVEFYPEDLDLRKFNAVSYVGIPLLDVNNNVLGNLAVFDSEYMPNQKKIISVISIFASRASAELQRLRAEKETLEREEKLNRLFDSAMDAIIELDKDFKITRLNSAALKLFGFREDTVLGRIFNRFLTKSSSAKLLQLAGVLNTKPKGEKFTWIPGGLKAVNEGGEEFPAEATISSFEMGNEAFYTLILRNVNDKLLAEQKIRSLTLESEYLKEELESLTGSEEIVGDSEPLLSVLRDVKTVARTGATVLILGETGTGKELIAKSIHLSSNRSDKPFVRVNCPAIPSSLIESEFFGHEKGAFTGATNKREGRFSVADKGTIFLDEVGELPIDLQSKLLRVLQEGEFEPLGSSKTVKVDVRVVAATNRDLLKEVEEGRFREDLYYRLNVFEIELPPLRERTQDIEKLSQVFIDKSSKREGISLDPLSEEDLLRLKSYQWPGNIRELQNVIERAVITATNGRLNLDKALPGFSEKIQPSKEQPLLDNGDNVLSNEDLKELEKKNIVKALERTHWKIAGKHGAAALLGLPTSTLNSKIKTLGIKRP